MPLIMPIRDLRNTSEISELAHKQQEPIFITKNGYSDLVVMSSELYDQFIKTNRIDQIIYESEKEMNEGAKSIDLDDAFKKLISAVICASVRLTEASIRCCWTGVKAKVFSSSEKN